MDIIPSDLVFLRKRFLSNKGLESFLKYLLIYIAFEMSKKIPEGQKLGKFYDFTVTEERFNKVQTMSNKKLFKNFRNAFIFGFLVEALMIRTKICKRIALLSLLSFAK